MSSIIYRNAHINDIIGAESKPQLTSWKMANFWKSAPFFFFFLLHHIFFPVLFFFWLKFLLGPWNILFFSFFSFFFFSTGSSFSFFLSFFLFFFDFLLSSPCPKLLLGPSSFSFFLFFLGSCLLGRSPFLLALYLFLAFFLFNLFLHLEDQRASWSSDRSAVLRRAGIDRPSGLGFV